MTDPVQDLKEWLVFTLEKHPESIKVLDTPVGVELQLWGGSIVFDPNLPGSGTYYVNDTSG